MPTRLRCPFHGFCWHLDGALKRVPSPWDFPQIEADEFGLPEARVGRWGGFVFVTMDPEAPSLEDFLGDLPAHFERWDLENRYTEAYVEKLLPCNWKIAQESFMESFHVASTHPQVAVATADSASQHDMFGNWSRAITPRGYPSEHTGAAFVAGQGLPDPLVLLRRRRSPRRRSPACRRPRSPRAPHRRDGLLATFVVRVAVSLVSVPPLNAFRSLSTHLAPCSRQGPLPSISASMARR